MANKEVMFVDDEGFVRMINGGGYPRIPSPEGFIDVVANVYTQEIFVDDKERQSNKVHLSYLPYPLYKVLTKLGMKE